MRYIRPLIVFSFFLQLVFFPHAHAAEAKGRNVMFVGVDISGSFKNSANFKDALQFMARYIHAHIKGYGDLEVPHSLFVGSIGGAKQNEVKTFFPIQNFKYKNVQETEEELIRIFDQMKVNKFTDFNAFFQQITTFVRNRKLSMKPISVILLSDGIPDAPKKGGKIDYRHFNLKPLENLSRNVTVRLLYTTADIGMNWQTQVPRNRVRIWTQDANVMKGWCSKDIFLEGVAIEKQERFFEWVRDNVDFPVRAKKVL